MSRLVIVLFFVILKSYSQSNFCQNLDYELSRDYAKIFTFYNADNDSLAHYSTQFSNKLVRTIEANTETLHCEFKTFKDSIGTVVTSDDGLLRIYSWNTWLGGSMTDYRSIFQFKSKNKVFVINQSNDENSSGSNFLQINSLNNNGKMYYLAINSGSLSSKDSYENITIFSIEGNKVVKVPIIKTKSGLTSTISFEYDFYSVVERPERPIQLIKYDSAKNTIGIPIVFENGKVTNKYIYYKLTGEFFEKIPKK
jgi:hypothetical protein